MFPSITPEMFAGSPIEAGVPADRAEPRRLPQAGGEAQDARHARRSPGRDEDVRAIAAPTLIVVGDSDVVRLEHAVGLFRLRGGGVMGDLAGLPDSQLAVLPGTTHFIPPGLRAPGPRRLAAGDDPAVPRRVTQNVFAMRPEVRAEYAEVRARLEGDADVPDAAGAVLHRAARSARRALRRRPALPRAVPALLDAMAATSRGARSGGCAGSTTSARSPRTGSSASRRSATSATPTASPARWPACASGCRTCASSASTTCT